MPQVLPNMDLETSAYTPKIAKAVKISFSSQCTMDLKKISIRDLLDHCLRANDQAGWNEFLERITPTISGVVYKRLCRRGQPDPSLVQDLVQDTLVKLFDKERAALERFEWRHEDAIYGYVKVVASRVVADYRQVKEDSLEENASVQEESGFFDQLQCAEIERHLEKLEAMRIEKDIFWFFFRSRYTAKEIGEMPGIDLSVKRVETILARLVRQIRAEMKRTKGGADSRF